MSHRTNLAVAIVAIVLTAAACGGGPDRSQAVAGAVDDVIVPAFVAAAETAADLDETVVGLCTGASDGELADARLAWKTAMIAWHRTEVGWGGPVDMDRLDSQIHYPLTAGDHIEDFIASHTPGAPIDVRDDLASTQRGLGAVEYLLFAQDDPVAVTEPARCELLAALTGAIAVETATASDAWTDSWDGGPAYADTLSGRADDAMGTDDALGEIVESIVVLLKDVTLNRLGKQLGITTTVADPDALGEGPAGAAGDLMAARIEGIDDIYSAGGDDARIGTLVADTSSEVDGMIRSDLDASLTAIPAFGSPFAEGLAADPDGAAALYDGLAELRRLFEADVVSLLDITLGFSDTDGDTG